MLTQNADGTCSYTPDANYNGADSFTYKANDGELDSNIATVTLTVADFGYSDALDVLGAQASRLHADGTSAFQKNNFTVVIIGKNSIGEATVAMNFGLPGNPRPLGAGFGMAFTGFPAI